MASDNSNPYDTKVAHAFLWPFKLLLKWTLLYSFVLFLAISFTFLFRAYVWNTDPQTQVANLVNEDFNRLNVVTNSGLFKNFAVKSSNFAYWLTFQTTGIHDALMADPESLKQRWENEPDRVYVELIQRYKDDFSLAMYAVELFGLRLGILVAALPIYALVLFASISDGLTERYIRKSCAGRESSDIFKLGGLLRLFGCTFLAMFYVCLPVAFNPLVVVLSIAALLAISTRAEFKYYKKYL